MRRNVLVFAVLLFPMVLFANNTYTQSSINKSSLLLYKDTKNLLQQKLNLKQVPFNSKLSANQLAAITLPLPDSMYLYLFHTAADSVLIGKTIYTFNSGRTAITSETNYQKDTLHNLWLGTNKDVYTFDANGNKTMHTNYIWNVTSKNWIGNFEHTYFYNSSGVDTSEIDYSWNKTSSAWANTYKYSYSLNGNGKETSSVTFMWDTTKWEAINKDTLYLDSKGNDTLDLQYALTITTINNITTYQWYNSGKTQYSYDSNGDITNYANYNSIFNHWTGNLKNQYYLNASFEDTLQYNYSWNASTNQWDLSEKIESIIGSSNFPSTQNYFSWNQSTSKWIPSEREIYTLDANNIISILATYVLNQSNQLVPIEKGYCDMLIPKVTITSFMVTFNTNGGSSIADTTVSSGTLINMPKTPVYAGHTFAGWYKDAAFTTAWNFGTDEITSNITIYAKWTTNTSISDENNNFISFYPNPASEILNIRLANSTSGYLKIYNITGEIIKSAVLNNQNEQILLNGINTGVYIIQIKTDTQTLSHKLVIK
jgi:uncharacterized repeat protein (TIGR02543 family)